MLAISLREETENTRQRWEEMCIPISCLFPRRKIYFQMENIFLPKAAYIFSHMHAPSLHEGLCYRCPSEPCWLCPRFFFFFKSLRCWIEPSEVIKATKREGKTLSEVSIYWGYGLSHSSELRLHCRIPAVSVRVCLFLQSYSHPQAAAALAETLTEWQQPERQKINTKSVILRYFKCSYTGWQQLPSGREEGNKRI